MMKRATILSLLAALSAAFTSAGVEKSNTPLTFYLLSKQSTNGGNLFDRFPFPKLGYISSKPDLIIEHLKEMSSLPESSRSAWAEDPDGTRRKATIVTAERFFFTLHTEDAARLRGLAEKASAQNQLVLVLYRDKAINLLRAENIVGRAQFEVIGNWGGDRVKEIANDLKDLVQQTSR